MRASTVFVADCYTSRAMTTTDDDDENFDDLAAMYREFGTWELEQLRSAIAEQRRTGRSPNGEVYDYPAAHYDRRLALIDQLLAERAGRQ